MSESATTEEPDEDETDTPDDPIVLEIPAGFATVGDPTDPDGERVITLPPAEEGADTKTFELPAADVDVARALLKNPPGRRRGGPDRQRPRRRQIKAGPAAGVGTAPGR